MKSVWMSVCSFVLLATVAIPLRADVVDPTTQFTLAGGGVVPGGPSLFYGGRGLEYQAFLEFESSERVTRAILNFTSYDSRSPSVLPLKSFSMYTYEANGQLDASDWDRGTRREVLTNSAAGFTHYSIDVTDAYRKYQQNGIQYIGFRFADVSTGDLLIVRGAQLNLSFVPEPSTLIVLPLIAVALLWRRRQ